MARRVRIVSSLLLMIACTGRPPRAAPSEPAGTCEPRQVPMRRTPGGALEVSPLQLAAHACGLRVIDVRDADALTGGVVPGAEHVPAARVLGASQRWPRDAPVVLVCGSGHRAKQVAAQLHALGFTRVAALAGGMRAWAGLKLPLAAAPAASRTG